MKVSIKFYIETISPIHIGCDEVYEPTGFVLDENKQQMIVFDPLSFISQMEDADKVKFSQICAKGTVASILEIYQFMRNKAVEGRMVDVCNDFIEHYRQMLSLPLHNERDIQQNLNNFSIPRTAFRTVDQRPYIPGSSIKGAFRTAYLNLMESEKKLSQGGREHDARNLEQRLMEYSGIPEEDPFRMVKVSDFMPLGEIRTRIIYGVNKKKKITDKDARGLPLIFEIVPSGSVFAGTIAVEPPLPGSGIGKHVSIEKLLKSATLFYTKERKREESELRNVTIEYNSDYDNFQGQNNSILLRIGRHSGAESVTIEGHRNIKIMGKKGDRPKSMDKATTFWLVSDKRIPKDNTGFKPFGWTEMHELTDNIAADFDTRESSYQEKHREYREQARDKIQKQREAKCAEAELEAKRAREEEEKRLSEEKRKKELEAMSPEERAIEEVRDPSSAPNRIVEIYNDIDGFSESNQLKLAEALKAYWQEYGHWKSKDCSRKQKEKVAKIKAILGEN